MALLAPSNLSSTSGMVPGRRLRVLFVRSSGGHLSQLLQLRPWWEQHDRRWVTFDWMDGWAARHPDVRW